LRDEAVAQFVGANPGLLPRRAPDLGYDLEGLAAGAENFIRLRIGVTAARNLFLVGRKDRLLPRFHRIDRWLVAFSARLLSEAGKTDLLVSGHSRRRYGTSSMNVGL